MFLSVVACGLTLPIAIVQALAVTDSDLHGEQSRRA